MTLAQGRNPRRLVIPALLTATGLTILISLGVWQLQRKEWKERLIANLEQRLSAPAVDLPPARDWPKLKREEAEFTRVRARVTFVGAPPAWLYSGGSALRADIRQPGYFVFAPARLPGGETVAIDAGYVAQREHAPLTGIADIVGIMRWPEAPLPFVSTHDRSGEVWFTRDHLAMAQNRGWGTVAPFYIAQEEPTRGEGQPSPGALTVRLRNDHLGYALTWFGLAAALAAVFAAWLAQWYNKTISPPPASL